MKSRVVPERVSGRSYRARSDLLQQLYLVCLTARCRAEQQSAAGGQRFEPRCAPLRCSDGPTIPGLARLRAVRRNAVGKRAVQSFEACSQARKKRYQVYQVPSMRTAGQERLSASERATKVRQAQQEGRCSSKAAPGVHIAVLYHGVNGGCS